MLIPVKKTNILAEKINQLFTADNGISDFMFNRLKDEIEKLTEPHEMNLLLGLLFGLKHDESKVMEHFSVALKLKQDETTFIAFINSLIQVCNYREALRIANKISDSIYDFFSFSSVSVLYTMFGDIEGLDKLNKRIQLLYGNQRAEYGDIMDTFVKNTNELKEAYKESGCSAEQICALTNIFYSVLRKYKKRCVRVCLSGIAGGLYIMNIRTDDSELISNMNMDFAELASSNTFLDNCELIGMFEVYQEGVDYGDF